MQTFPITIKNKYDASIKSNRDILILLICYVNNSRYIIVEAIKINSNVKYATRRIYSMSCNWG